MNINQIIKELSTILEFSSKHSFLTINLDVIAIQEANLRILKLFQDKDNDMKVAIGIKIEQELNKLVQEGIIKDINKNPNRSVIEIIPNNLEEYKRYPGGSGHYCLISYTNQRTSIA